MLKEDRKALIETLEPFERVLVIHDALPEDFNPGDASPLRSSIPGAWPSVGELRALVEAARAAIRHES